MAKKLKETYIHTDIHTDRLPLVVLSAAVAAKNGSETLLLSNAASSVYQVSGSLSASHPDPYHPPSRIHIDQSDPDPP